MVLWPHRTRTENPGGSVAISHRGIALTLVPRKKKAFITERPGDTEDPKDDEAPGLFGTVRKLVADPQYLPESKRELLGESDIDGRRAVGYRLTSAAGIMTIWADPDTLLPIQTEMVYRKYPGMKSIATDYVYNVDLDESLFSVEPPPDYTVLRRTQPKKDSTPYKESDLVELFRQYRENGQDAFPETVDATAAHELQGMKFDLRKERTEEEWREIHEFGRKVDRGPGFVAELPTEADAHYAGKGVKFDATDTPIFWYRPGGEGKYRVIRADLSVVEVDSPPKIPGAQALGDWERDARASRRPSPKPAAAAAYTVENLAPLVRQLGILPFSLRNELRVRVLPGSVAEKAGMRTGDQVTTLYGLPVERIEQVAAVWALVPFYAKAQETLREEGVPLTILRDGEQVEVTLPGDALEPFLNPKAQDGYDLKSLAALVRQIGIEPDSDEPTWNDVVKVRILPNSAAAKAGIRSGDRITALNGAEVVRLKDVLGLVAWVPLDDEWRQRVSQEGVRLTLLRKGEKIEVTLPGDVFTRLVLPAGLKGR
jgi:hypothetical protein